MTLDQYLTSTGITAAKFGELVDMSEASVSRIRRGGQNITREVMLRIIAASKGRITPAGLVNPAPGEGITSKRNRAPAEQQKEAA